MVSIFIYHAFAFIRSVSNHGFISKPSITTLHCILVILLPVSLFLFCKYLRFVYGVYILNELTFQNPLLLLLLLGMTVIDCCVLIVVVTPLVYFHIQNWYNKVDTEYDNRNKIPK